MNCPRDGGKMRLKHNNSTVQLEPGQTLRYRVCEEGHEYTTIEVALEHGMTIADIVRLLSGAGG